MKHVRAIGWAAAAVLVSAGAVAAASRPDAVAEALAEVRNVKADLFSDISSELGRLPGPAELAAQQLRARPAPVPKAGVDRRLRFDAATVRRAAELDVAKVRSGKGRMGLRVLPLGITGAYFTEVLGQAALFVVAVLPDSPAAGRLEVDDVIIGANGRLFADPEDPRPEMGHALVESQSPRLGGILTLHVIRRGKCLNVTLDLGETQPFAETWPFDCPKTRRIRKAALELVIRSYPWHRYDFWTPLFLMASGDERALELARRHLCAKLQDRYEPNTGAGTWRDSYTLISLCEYYLLTGDSSVLPAVRHFAEGLAWAQYRSGSWSHGGGKGPNSPAPGTVSGGYGEINCAGLGAFVGLCLARQCGVEPFAGTLPRSIRFFGKFCGSNFPYGLGTPSDRSGRMDNGMNSMAAVGFYLLGAEEMARRWARTVCYMWMGRERGHAEGIFSAAWGPIGAALAPREEFHAFMNQMRWAYELGRARDGGLTFMRGSRWTYPNMTAAMGLFLYLPERRLQILGGDSVFARPVPRGLEKAALYYKAKQWAALKAFLEKYLASAKGGPAGADGAVAWAKDMLAAYGRVEEHAAATLKMIEENIAAGRGATARLQLDLLAKFLGEQRPEAAALRKRLGEGPLRDPRREAPAPLVDVKAVVQQLKLGRSGVGDGFAHSGEYIARANARGLEGLPDEQVARFLGHFSGGVAGGAAEVLASRGKRVLPLLRRLLKDSHPGIRAGALATLTRMFRPEGEEYRTNIPPELAEVIHAVRPLLHDESVLVRNAAGGFVQAIRVMNAETYEMMLTLARDGADVSRFVRYGVKDPAARVKLCMTCVEAANRLRSKVPARYKPIALASSAHLELCGPYVRTAINTLNNPEVLLMYGFFSNSPPNAALEILDRYHDDPLVLDYLGDVFRFAARKRGGMDSYWYPIVEYPHRLVIRLGPKAAGPLEAFLKSEAEYYRRIDSGAEARPPWWKPDTIAWFADWSRQMRETLELARCLHGARPAEEAMAVLCRVYLSSRPWGAWERQQIREHITRLGPAVLAAAERELERQLPALRGELEKRLAAGQAALDAAEKKARKPLQKQVESAKFSLAELDARVAEWKQMIELVRICAREKPTAGDVRTLCAFYTARPWGTLYPFVKDNCSYVRPMFAAQLALVRRTLLRWGAAAGPELRAFLQADGKRLAADLAALDKEEAFWRPQWARKALMPLSRIAQEREDIQRISAELHDVATVIEAAGSGAAAGELPGLCRIYTRRDWPEARRILRDLFLRAGRAGSGVIARHVRSEKAALAEVEARIRVLMSDTVKERVKWRYDRARAEERAVRSGIADLEALLR